jgi:hypothetical protein
MRSALDALVATTYDMKKASRDEWLQDIDSADDCVVQFVSRYLSRFIGKHSLPLVAFQFEAMGCEARSRADLNDVNF